MRNNRLTVSIDRPVTEVFEFTLNPRNTPLWIEGIEQEEVSAWPVKLGDIYKNRGPEGSWSEYRVSALIENREFQLSAQDNHYHVRYSYQALAKDTTQLEYYEWVTDGELKKPFEQAAIEKLKFIIESRA